MMTTGGGMEKDDMFEQAFAPLAHHLFPDGCPDNTEGPELSSIWPLRTDRSAVPAKDALAAIGNLRRAVASGLTQGQLWAVTLAACETLPKMEASGAGSPLVDGTSKCFRDLVRCLIPRNRDDNNNNNGGIPSAVVMKLVSSRCDAPGKVTVLRFLTLAVRSGALLPEARQVLSNLYGVILPWVAEPQTCMDTVRLLHAVTRRKHVRVDRAQRLSNWYNKGGNDGNKLSSIWLLLQLYARYDPTGCGKYFPSSSRTTMGSGAWSRCFQIPDTKWERDFLADSDEKLDTQRPAKRARITDGVIEQRNSSLALTLDWLNDAFDGVHSFSWGLVGNRERRSLRASDLLSDTSLQQLILLSTKNSNHSSVADTEVIRLRACLPYMLHEEWYEKHSSEPVATDDGDDSSDESVAVDDDKDDDSSLQLDNDDDQTKNEPVGSNEETEEAPRLQLLKALASMASRSDGLFPEAESFLVEEILPHWDGSDRMGLCLCFDLLPMLTPCSFADLQSKVLRYLELLFTYGSPRIQHAITSGVMKGLLERWGRLDWADVSLSSRAPRTRRPDQDDEDDSNARKSRTLREFVKWADNLFLKGLLVNDGHELLRVSIVDFFETVASLSTSGPFLASPSPALVYRLLLTQSALSVDRVCTLLISFRKVFQRLKEQQDVASDGVRASDRIALFNCFIWDFSCFLWKGSPLPSLDPATGSEARSNSICFTDLSRETLELLHKESAHVRWALSITHGATFAGYAKSFLKKHKLEESPNVIRGKTKVKYLQYLKDQGLNGVYSFLTTFVASLANRESKRQRARDDDNNNNNI